jgi:hypothetical protein
MQRRLVDAFLAVAAALTVARGRIASLDVIVGPT